MNAEDLEFLLKNVDNPHSDYNDEVDGYLNYWVTDRDTAPVLHVRFSNDDGVVEAEWDLIFRGDGE
jgi:hypothetical protein